LHGLSTLKGPISLLWIVERLAGGELGGEWEIWKSRIALP